jgi:hypothetical protein
MNDPETDETIDRWLAAVLAAEPQTDGEAFTALVCQKISRQARRRRALLMTAYAAAGVLGLVNVSEASAVLASLTPASLAGSMMLSAACGVVWIGTLD